MRATLPNRAYLNDFERFLRGLNSDGQTDFTLAIPAGLFSVHPLATTMIASAGLAIQAAGATVHVEGMTANPSTRYLERIGLFDMLGFESGITLTPHEEAGRFLPLRQVRTNEQLNDFIVDVVPLLHATPTQAAPVKYVLYELVRNVLEHARSRNGAVAAAQITSSGRLLIAVSDCGVGIRSSLGVSYPTPDDRHAIALAFRPGITGVTRRVGGNETNAGAGLFFLKAMAQVAGHHMVVISGTSMFKLLTVRPGRRHLLQTDVNADRVTWGTLDQPWSGTAVGIDLTIEDETLFNSLLSFIGKVYDVDVRDRKRAIYRARFGELNGGAAG